MSSFFYRLGIAFLFLYAFGALIVQGQVLPPRIGTFDSRDHGAHHQILSVEPLPDGRTAFGTLGKVLIHDGEGFIHIPVGPGKYVRSLERGDRGRLYMGGNGILGFLTSKTGSKPEFHSLFSRFPQIEKENEWTVWLSPEGDLHFHSRSGLYVLEEKDSLKKVSDMPIERVHSSIDPPWVQDAFGKIYRLKHDELELLEKVSERRMKPRSVLSAPKGTKGDLTIFTERKGAYSYSKRSKDPAPIFEKKAVSDFGSPSDHRIREAVRLNPTHNPYGAAFALGTTLGGVFLLDSEGEVLLRIDMELGLPADRVWDLEVDQGGNLWGGTNNGAALLWTGSPFTHARSGHSFKGGVSDMVRLEGVLDKENAPFFISTLQGGWKWCQEHRRFEKLRGTDGECMELIPFQGTEEHDLLIAGESVFSYELQESTEHPVLKVDTLLQEQAYDICPLPFPSEKGVAIGGSGGVHILVLHEDQTKPEELFHLSQFPEAISSLAYDTSGLPSDSIRIWATMPSEGFFSITMDTAFQGKKIQYWESSSELPQGVINVMEFPGKPGQVLFSSPKGLFIYQDMEFQPFCGFGDLFCQRSGKVHAIDRRKEIWISHSVGAPVKEVELNEEGEVSRIDSMDPRGLDPGVVRSILSEKGKIWAGGDRGLAAYHPQVKKTPERPWNCFFRKIVAGKDSVLYYRGVSDEMYQKKPKREGKSFKPPRLSYTKNRLKFSFTAPSPGRQDQVVYRYRLLGFDQEWSGWTHAPVKSYTGLSEGNYRFQVQAKDLFNERTRTTEYAFEILPPWYRTWQAYLGYSGGGIALLILGAWLASKRWAYQKKRLEGLVERRTQEVQRKNEELKAKNRRVEEAHAELNQSIEYARTIQQAILHAEDHVTSEIPEHFILFKPQVQVSGDFHWGKVHQGSLYAAVVDCTGHGVPGAMMSMLGISQLNEIMTVRESPTPGQILTDLRERITAELQSGDSVGGTKDGMDAAIVRIPLGKSHNSGSNSKKVEFAGANNPLYVVKEGIGEAIPEVHFKEDLSDSSDQITHRIKPFKKSSHGFEIKGDKMAVGYEPHTSGVFRTIELEVPSDAMLYLSSDGYPDQFGGPKGKKFRYSPFKELLARIHTLPSEEQKQELERVFEEWMGDRDQVDDVCVVGIRMAE